MKKHVCFTTKLAEWNITLEQQASGRSRDFTVTYGSQVKDHLTYAQAARELGSCLMHALSCEGQVDNSQADDVPEAYANPGR
jgi:hypothetical protein